MTQKDIMQVYRDTMLTAKIYRERAELKSDPIEKNLYQEISQHLYRVCADLEMTEEINPMIDKKKVVDQILFDYDLIETDKGCNNMIESALLDAMNYQKIVIK